jgi:hypothetical protein
MYCQEIASEFKTFDDGWRRPEDINRTMQEAFQNPRSIVRER